MPRDIESGYQTELQTPKNMETVQKNTKSKLLELAQQEQQIAEIQQLNASHTPVDEILETEEDDEFDSLWEQFAQAA